MPKRSEEMLMDLWMSLLLVWITCVPYVSMTPIIGQSKSAQTGGSAAMASGLGEGQRLLSRAKRGWVWNQMFVLEEFSGPDPILVGRLFQYKEATCLHQAIIKAKDALVNKTNSEQIAVFAQNLNVFFFVV
ncbi:hypothetical protein PAMP_000914 [Pampus punctatissimus]